MTLRIAAVLLFSALYLAIAVLAYGSLAAFLDVPALAALAAATVLAAVAGACVGGSLSAGVKEDRANRWVLPVFGVLGLLLVALPPWADARGVWTLGGDGTRWTGVVLFVLGCALRLAPVHVLGHRFSGLVALQPGHRLVTTGLYGTIRHPSYLGLMIASLGWALAFRSVIGLIITALHLIPLLARIAAEERFLAGEFGAEYEAYRARTARLIPGVF